MAWRSSGETNAELVDNLVQNGLITNSEVEEGFRRVDRKFFVPKGCEDEAYSDRPVKEGNVHISAPHIYCTVLEALQLTPGASLSFLNIGSGSGYLSCIASEILGPKSLYYGIEIREDALNHCRHAVASWYAESSKVHARTQPFMHFFHGNGLDIKADVGESVCGFDRIYAGAAITSEQHKKIRKLLSPGGVMIAPVEDELLKVVRIRPTSISLDNQVSFDEDDYDFATQIILGVSFAPLLKQPKISTVIPAARWGISNHHLYPESFQKATKTLLLCKNSNAFQAIERTPNDDKNVAASLPKEVWLYILSFTTRKWFEPVNTERDKEILKSRLVHGQRNLSRTKRALTAAESNNMILQRQNDIYLQMARHFHEHIQGVLDQSSNDFSTNVHLSPALLQSTQSLLRESRDVLFPLESHQMDESHDTMNDEDLSEDDENTSDDDDDDDDDDEDMSEISDSESINDHMMEEISSLQVQLPGGNTRQIRTVSISSADH